MLHFKLGMYILLTPYTGITGYNVVDKVKFVDNI